MRHLALNNYYDVDYEPAKAPLRNIAARGIPNNILITHSFEGVVENHAKLQSEKLVPEF